MLLDRILKTFFASRTIAKGKAMSTLDEARRLIGLRQIDEASRILETVYENERKTAKALNLFGEVAFYRKEDEKSESFFRAALREEPENLDGHFGLSKLLFEQGRFQDAVLHAHYCQTHDKSNGHFAAQAALCFLGVDDAGQAYWAALRAVTLEPGIARYWNDLAIAQRTIGRPEEAEQGFRRALELDPNLEQAKENFANLLAEIETNSRVRTEDANSIAVSSALLNVKPVHGEASQPVAQHPSQVDPSPMTEMAPSPDTHQSLEDAESDFDASPDNIDTALALARLLEQNGQIPAAIDVLTVALAHHPVNLAIRRMRGVLYKRAHHPRKAALDLVKVLKGEPEDPEVLSALADLYGNDGRFEEAIDYLKRCAVVSDKIGYKVQLANMYVSACRYEDGLRLYDSILEQDPTTKPSIDFGYGVALYFLGQFERSEPYIDQAIQLSPYNADTRFLRGSLRFLLGNYAAGWDDYHYRVYSDQDTSIRLLPMPLWNGESPAGKRILLLAEQGLGDQVMFASLVPDLLALNPEQIIIEAHKRIAKTLARSFPQCLVIPTMQLARFDWLRTLPPIDYYLPIAELAQFFRPNAESFPKHKGFMIADPHRIAFWKKRLDTLGNGMKIGVSWRGGLPQTRRPVRSLQLSELTPLLQLPNTHFISLQYGKIGPEIRDVEKTVGIPIANWPEGISDLDEFAALVSALDLIITVCNTTVHYAGALNMPVWVMTPKIPDWRYGLSGTTMDWYPSARMFRQPEHGDWTTVLNDVLRALAACLQERRTESPRL